MLAEEEIVENWLTVALIGRCYSFQIKLSRGLAFSQTRPQSRAETTRLRWAIRPVLTRLNAREHTCIAVF